MWPFLVLHMVTYHSADLRCMEITDKWRVWTCSRSHIIWAVNPTSPEAVELTDTAESNSSPLEECVTQQALDKQHRHIRVPTGKVGWPERFIALLVGEQFKTPARSHWQEKIQRAHSSHPAPSPDSCLSKLASAICGKSWLSQLISAQGCTQLVSPQPHLPQPL